MVYTKTTWVNDTTPFINADNLNKIENGIADAVNSIPASYTIYKANDGTIYAKANFEEGTDYSGTDATTVIQNAIDNANGAVYISEGTYLLTDATNFDITCLYIKEGVRLIGAGIGKTILKLSSNIQKTMIMMDNNTELAWMEIDGNYQNNLQGEENWSDVTDVPFTQGVYTSYSDNTNGYQEKEHIYVHDIYVHDTLRSNIVFCGKENVLENVYCKNSYTDHLLYYTGATDCIARNVFCEGMADREAVVIGHTESSSQTKNSILDGVIIRNLSAGKWYYPQRALHVRDQPDQYLNYISNARLYIDATFSSTNLFAISIDSPTFLRNIHINMDGEAGNIHYYMSCYGNMILDGFKFETTSTDKVRGILIIASSREIDNLIVKNGSIECNGGNAKFFLANGNTHPIIYYIKDVGLDGNASVIFDEAGDVTHIVEDIRGYTTENSGIATILNGNTSVTVNHGLAETPTKVIVTPQADTRYWVDNVGTSTFRINIPTALSSDVSFYWKAEV